MSWLDDLVERWWPERAEAPFHTATGAVTLALYDAWRANERDEADTIFQAIALARRKWPMEPNASILDHAYALAAACLGEWAVNEHDFKGALNYVQLGWQALDEKIARREELGLTPAMSSDARLRLLLPLADTEWRQPELDLPPPIPPIERQVEILFERAAAIERRIEALQPEKADFEHYVSPILWSGTALAIVALRSSEELNLRIVDEVNRWSQRLHGNFILERDLNHWRTVSEGEPRHRQYWHYEIAKVWLAEISAPVDQSIRPINDTIRELSLLYDQLQQSVDVIEPLSRNLSYSSGVERDRDWMLRILRQRRFGLL